MEKRSSINRLLNIVTFLYRKSFWTLIGYTVVAQMLIGTITYFVSLFSQLIGMQLMVVSAYASPIAPIIGGVLYYIFIMLLTVVMRQVVLAGFIQGIQEARQGRKAQFGDMFKYAMGNIGYSVTSSIPYAFFLSLISGVIIGIYVAVNIGLVYMFVDNSAMNLGWQGVAWIFVVANILLTLLAAIPVIWYATKTIFYLPIAVVKKVHFMEPIIESFSMSKNNFKRYAGFLITLVLVSFVISSGLLRGVYVMAGITMGLASLANEGMMVVVGILMYLLFLLVVMIASALVVPISNMFIAVAYFEEQDIIYGNDLYNRLEVLERKHQESLKAKIGGYSETTNI